ncbi:hypothetical protein MASR2M18_11080 [Ignavibacteria bacterium]|nr:septum formation initiator family protein [Bacteroidota bacterium]MCZ2133359.1 septum formation initiator family protein [Bacteroidota bacterium]
MSQSANRRRNYYRIAVAGVIVFAVWFGLFSGYGTLTRSSLESDCTDIRTQIEAQQKTADSLRKYTKALLYDTIEIERIARERYGMIKPGEKVYIIRKEE